MDIWIVALIGAACLALGFGIAFWLQTRSASSRVQWSRRQAEQIVDEARKQADLTRRTAEVEAKEIIEKRRSELEEEARQRLEQVSIQEKRLTHREETLDKRADLLDRQEQDHKRRDKELQDKEKEILLVEQKAHELEEQAGAQLERVAGMTREEAKKQLLDGMLEEAKLESAKFLKEIEEETKLEADKRAKKIIATSIQRFASDFVSEATVSVVHLPNDDMKGRIIGREGRNIRALEAATGMDLIIDDTPEAVIISGFDPVRREIARSSLEKLIADGRIHPARIEEVVAKSTEEIEAAIKEAGERAVFELGIHGLHPDLVRCIGRLKYRTSYSQNQLQHSIEVGFLAGIMSAELGLNQKLARRAGLLHDIGKAVDHEVEGSHAVIGADLAKKYGESPKIVHAIRAHHEDEKPDSVLAVLVQAADALSGARPGARREMLETYVKRLEELERICRSFKGVEKAFAIQAGREVRVIVENSKVTDEKAVLMSKEIAKKIETDLTYPGQIRVTVIRETRAVEYAK